MNEHEARSVVLVRALEETDAQGEIVPLSERLAATRNARLALDSSRHSSPEPGSSDQRVEERFAVERAQFLVALMEERFPIIRAVLRRADWPGSVGFLVGAGALLAGVLTNYLSAERRINILAFPLLGMFLWNAGVYFFSVAGRLRRGLSFEARKSGSSPLVHTFARILDNVWGIAGRWKFDGSQPALARMLKRFFVDWGTFSRDLQRARARFLLHLGAACLASGAVAGMYLRGIAFEYRAGWESTFLSAAEVHAIVKVVLGPSAWLTGLAIPDVNGIAAMRWGPGVVGQNAADWIHLYAVTAGWVVAGPRLVLALARFRLTRRLTEQFVFPADSDVERLLRRSDSAGVHVCAVPYGLQLDTPARELLQALGLEVFGWNAQIEFKPPIRYGLEDLFVREIELEQSAPVDCWVLVLNMASTPEPENHGLILAHAKRLGTGNGGNCRTLVLVDQSSYRARFGSEPGLETRLTERRRLWCEFVEGYGLRPALVDLNADRPAAMFEAVRSILAERGGAVPD